MLALLPGAAWEQAVDHAAALTRQAVELARQAARGANRPIWIAGSQAPIGDCYEPNRDGDREALQAEHTLQSQALAAAGVDLILVETHPTLTEALAATRAALETGLPVVTSFVCDPHGRLLSGEPLAAAARQVASLPVVAISVNCVLADTALAAVQTLAAVAQDRAVGVYANVGWFTPESGWRNSASVDPRVYAQHAAMWLEAGVRLLGSCCGTTPEHIRALRRLIDRAAEISPP